MLKERRISLYTRDGNKATTIATLNLERQSRDHGMILISPGCTSGHTQWIQEIFRIRHRPLLTATEYAKIVAR